MNFDDMKKLLISHGYTDSTNSSSVSTIRNKMLYNMEIPHVREDIAEFTALEITDRGDRLATEIKKSFIIPKGSSKEYVMKILTTNGFICLSWKKAPQQVKNEIAEFLNVLPNRCVQLLMDVDKLKVKHAEPRGPFTFKDKNETGETFDVSMNKFAEIEVNIRDEIYTVEDTDIAEEYFIESVGMDFVPEKAVFEIRYDNSRKFIYYRIVNVSIG